MALNPQSHVAAVLLDDLHIDEVLAQALYHTEKGTLHENVRRDLVQRELLLQDFLSCLFLVFGALDLGIEVENGLDDDAGDLGRREHLARLLCRKEGSVEGLLQCRVLHTVRAQDALSNFIDLLLDRQLSLDLDHETRPELILDVLRRPKAFEDATFHHNAHFGAERFSFLHGVRGQNDGTCLVTGDLTHNSPHETASFRVHAGRRLVEKDDGWAADDGESDGKFALVAT